MLDAAAAEAAALPHPGKAPPLGRRRTPGARHGHAGHAWLHAPLLFSPPAMDAAAVGVAMDLFPSLPLTYIKRAMVFDGVPYSGSGAASHHHVMSRPGASKVRG